MRDFDWDPAKRDKVLGERGIDFADAVAIFGGRVHLLEDTRKDYGEVRVIAVGLVREKFVTLVYTDRGDTRWIITAWRSNRKERAAWQKSPWPKRWPAPP